MKIEVENTKFYLDGGTIVFHGEFEIHGEIYNAVHLDRQITSLTPGRITLRRLDGNVSKAKDDVPAFKLKPLVQRLFLQLGDDVDMSVEKTVEDAKPYASL